MARKQLKIAEKVDHASEDAAQSSDPKGPADANTLTQKRGSQRRVTPKLQAGRAKAADAIARAAACVPGKQAGAARSIDATESHFSQWCNPSHRKAGMLALGDLIASDSPSFKRAVAQELLMSADADDASTPESLELYLHIANAEVGDINRELALAKRKGAYGRAELLRLQKETVEGQISLQRVKLKLDAMLASAKGGSIPVEAA
jgi:hypothetical protein